MKSIREIKTDTVVGRLLFAAIAVITTLPGYTDKHPDEALADVKRTADLMYKDEPPLQSDVEILAELFERIEGCADADCTVCRGIKANIEKLAKQLELTPEQTRIITPRWLRRLENV